MRSCLAGSAPHYLRAFCTPVSSLHSRSSLRSSARGYLVVPRVRTCTAQSRSVAIVGPNSWNHLPQSLRTDLFSISFDHAVPQAPENLSLPVKRLARVGSASVFRVALYKCFITITITIQTKHIDVIDLLLPVKLLFFQEGDLGIQAEHPDR